MWLFTRFFHHLLFLMLIVIIVATTHLVIVPGLVQASYTTVIVVSFHEYFFAIFLLATNATKSLWNFLEGNLFVTVLSHYVTLVTIEIQIFLTSHIQWLLSSGGHHWWRVPLLHHEIVRNWIRMIPALILELFWIIWSLVPGAHFLHRPIFKHIIIQRLICLCPCLLLEMFIFWVANVC